MEGARVLQFQPEPLGNMHGCFYYRPYTKAKLNQNGAFRTNFFGAFFLIDDPGQVTYTLDDSPEEKERHHVMQEIIDEVAEETEILTQQITDNVDETGEDADFTIKCTLKSDKDGQLSFTVDGKATLKRPKRTKLVKIIDRQLTLSY